MTTAQSQRIRAFINNRRANAERRQKQTLNPGMCGSQPRTSRELNIAMVAEEAAKLAILNDLEALLNQVEAGQ